MALVFFCVFFSMVSLCFYHGSCYRKLLQLLQHASPGGDPRSPSQARGHKEVAKVHGGHQALWPLLIQSLLMFSGKQTPPRTTRTREFPHVFDVRLRVSNGVLWIEVHGPRRSLKQR